MRTERGFTVAVRRGRREVVAAGKWSREMMRRRQKVQEEEEHNVGR